MANDKRKHARVPLMMLIQVRARDYEAFLHEYAPNISQGGLFLETDKIRPEGTMLYFQFTTSDEGPLIEGLGRVVRVVPPEGAKKGGLGIEFVSVEEPSRARITEIVEERTGTGL